MYNIVELFSGIGSQAKALKNLGIEVNTLGTCEWNIHAMIAYDAIHNSPSIPIDYLLMSKKEILQKLKEYCLSIDGKNKMSFEILSQISLPVLQRIAAAIDRNKNYVDISSLTGAKMPDNIDILTYSFPCQDLSNVGAFHGYNKGIDKDSGSRSSLLWQVGRILKEMKENGKCLPRYLLMENVPALLQKRHIQNFNIWIEELEELGYISGYYELNAKEFGIKQNRPRLIMISVYAGDDAITRDAANKYFLFRKSDDFVADYKLSDTYKDIPIDSLFRIDYNDPKLLEEAIDCTPNDTESRRKIWEENPQLVLKGNVINREYDYIRTITTKQDRNPNSGNLYFESGIDGKGKFRYLTPRECMLFMGFTDEDYENIVKNNPEIKKGTPLFSRDAIIRMAGNSIPVKMLEGVFWQIIILDNAIEELHGQA